MEGFLHELLGSSAFMPHGHCYLWTPTLLWLQVSSNALIALAYFAIAGGLAVLVRRVDEMPFGTMYWAFSTFIFACGVTHAFDVLVIWEPYYWVDAGFRVVTAVASLGTALLLLPLIPKAVTLIRGARSAMQRGKHLETVVEDLESMYEKTKELERQKTRFFANVSHELRTPLTLTVGRARQLLDADDLAEEHRDDLSSIVANSELLLKHVDDLLEIAQFDAGRLEVDAEVFDLERLIHRVAGTFDGLADDCDITYRIEGPDALRVGWDRSQIESVLINLLSNAFKFTPDGGEIRVEYRERDDDRHPVEIAVHDSGPGVPPDQREAIFERFHREQSDATSRFGGTGLGLVIVDNLVEMHDGEVFVQDAPEGGARFVVRLPRQVAGCQEGDEREAEELADSSSGVIVDRVTESRGRLSSGAPAHRPTPPPTEAGPDDVPVDVPETVVSETPRVLVVEDNTDMNDFICKLLVEDFFPIPAFDGREALSILEEQSIDLVITDVMMPNMDGIELIDALKADPDTAEIPILVLTARADSSLRTELLGKGIDDFISKPFSNEELLARVSNLGAIHRTRVLLQRDLESRHADIAELASELSDKTSVLEHLALYDQLTELPNRALLEDRVEQAIERAKRRQTPFALAFIDLDDFKSINDSLGHAAGDELLRQSATRLREVFRGEDTVARLGGDEFVVLVEAVDERSILDSIGGRLRSRFEPAFRIADTEVYLSVSVGFAYPSPDQVGEAGGLGIENLMQTADEAMYEAKRTTGTSWRIFEFTSDREPSRRIQRRNRIRRGAEADEFVPYYQPILELETRRVVGLEMLTRWHHPEHGCVGPGEFIELAEQTDLICTLGQSVAERACRQFDSTRDLPLSADPLRLFVNLSPRQVEHPDAADRLIEVFDRELPDRLQVCFEITEGELLEHHDRILEIRERGCEIVIDDFGTGYSSLSRLKQLPVDGLKLDMEFIHGLTESTADRAIVASVLQLGGTLDLSVIAEGIETDAQLEALAGLGCQFGQGFLFARPQPFDHLSELADD